MPDRPPVERVVAAAERLHDLNLGRISTTLIRFFMVKAIGAGGGSDARMTTADAINFADRFFRVPGQDPYLWFEPLAYRWQKDSPNGGWPVGTLWTQIQRPNQALRRLVEVQPAERVDGEVEMRVQVKDDDEAAYSAALADIIPPEKRLPAVDFALWRYRFGIPSGVTTASSLVESLCDELRLTALERGELLDESDADDTPIPVASEWPDADLARLLPDPRPSLQDAGEEPLAPNVPDSEDDYSLLAEYADFPLESADINALTAAVKALVDEEELLLPDEGELIERCVTNLLTGHLVLQGPPGTGKTTLAKILAAAFDCRFNVETATADWSTFDVIGGFQPAIGSSGEEVLRPWLGHIPRAALRCAETVRDHHADPGREPYEAHWLIIDEFSRAEMDKAIGGLYTVLGGEDRLSLWFADSEKRREIWIPHRFRIIGTMNDVDTSFVYSFSQGLSRRFQFVYVGVPLPDQVNSELDAALSQAVTWYVDTYPAEAGTDRSALAAQARDDGRIADIKDILTGLLSYLRYGGEGEEGGWPVGTAQVVDLWKQVVLRMGDPQADLRRTLDIAAADRIVPQMSNVAPPAIIDFISWLTTRGDLPRTLLAVRHLRNTQATAF